MRKAKSLFSGFKDSLFSNLRLKIITSEGKAFTNYEEEQSARHVQFRALGTYIHEKLSFKESEPVIDLKSDTWVEDYILHKSLDPTMEARALKEMFISATENPLDKRILTISNLDLFPCFAAYFLLRHLVATHPEIFCTYLCTK